MSFFRDRAERATRYSRPSVNGIIFSINRSNRTATVKVQDDPNYWYDIPFAANRRLLRVGSPVIIEFPESNRFRPCITGEATVEIIPKKENGVDPYDDDPITPPTLPNAIMSGMLLDVERNGYPGPYAIITPGSYRLNGTIIAFDGPGTTGKSWHKWGMYTQEENTHSPYWGTGRYWGEVGAVVELTTLATGQRYVLIEVDESQEVQVTYGDATAFGTDPDFPGTTAGRVLVGYILQKGASYEQSGGVPVVLRSDLDRLPSSISSTRQAGRVSIPWYGNSVAQVVQNTSIVIRGSVLSSDDGAGLEGVAIVAEILNDLDELASSHFAQVVRRPAIQYTDRYGNVGAWEINIGAIHDAHPGPPETPDCSGWSFYIRLRHAITNWESSTIEPATLHVYVLEEAADDGNGNNNGGGSLDSLAIHRTTTPIDHPDGSVTSAKLAALAGLVAGEYDNPTLSINTKGQVTAIESNARTLWVPLTGGGPTAPELIFDGEGQCIMIEEVVT